MQGYNHFHHLSGTSIKYPFLFRYYYKCGSSTNGVSSTFHFDTAPAHGSKEEVNIIIYGDEGVFEYSYFTISHVTELVTNSQLEIDFIYHLGDFGYGNERSTMWYEYSWDLFFEQNQSVMTVVPYMTLPGIYYLTFLPPILWLNLSKRKSRRKLWTSCL